MKTLDIKTALVIAVPTGFVTSLTMNFLEDQYSWPVAFAIGAVAGILSGLVALGACPRIRSGRRNPPHSNLITAPQTFLWSYSYMVTPLETHIV